MSPIALAAITGVFGVAAVVLAVYLATPRGQAIDRRQVAHLLVGVVGATIGIVAVATWDQGQFEPLIQPVLLGGLGIAVLYALLSRWRGRL